MNNRNILITGVIIIVALFTVNHFLNNLASHGDVESITESIGDLKENNALVSIGLNDNSIELSDIAKIQNVVSKQKKHQEIEVTYAEVEEREKRINQIYQMDQKKMHLYLDEIKENQEKIKKWKREHGIKVSALENIKPEFALTLATLLNSSVEKAVEMNREDLELSSREWYFVKTFAESDDLKKLMKQGKLNGDYVNISNLEMVYSNNPQVVHHEDGKIDGLPVDTEVDNDSEESVELDNID